MSKVLADTLQGRATGNEAPDFPKGATITGVCTATSFSGNITGNATGLTGTPSITVQDIVAVGGTFSGVLTYEDVTNVDSVGIVTARLGVRVLAGGIQVVGLTTVAADGILVGTGASIFQPASNTLTLGTNSSESARFDSSGRLMLGTITEGSSGADEFTINTASGHGGMTIRNDTSSNGNIWFSDGTSGAAEYAGYVQYAHNGDALVFGANGGERARITKTGGLSLNNGELIERCNISASTLNSDTAINLDNGMVHYRTSAIGAASVKPNIYSSVGINTQMATGDIITVTIITACSSTSNFVDHIMVDYKDVTESWVGGSAPTDGGGSGVDTYAFNIIKTASETFTVIGNHVKTS